MSLNANMPRYFIEHYMVEGALGYFAAMAYIFVAGNTVMAALGGWDLRGHFVRNFAIETTFIDPITPNTPLFLRGS